MPVTTTMAVLKWLGINTILPLFPIGFTYLAIWLRRKRIAWASPIRDGQVCFYATTIAIIAVKDIIEAKPTDTDWLFGLGFCWFVSFFVYSFSIFSTLYPEATEELRTAIDRRYAVASLACGLLTTAMVVGLRLNYGVLK
jgi:hypothetical protein